MFVVASALIAAAWFALLPRPKEVKQLAAADRADERAPAQSRGPTQPPRQSRPAAKPEKLSTSSEEPNQAPPQGGTIAPDSQPNPPPGKADEPAGLTATERQALADVPLTGLVADVKPEPVVVAKKPPPDPVAEAKTEPVVVTQEPPPGIVADTPQTLYAERTKPKTPDWLAAHGGTIESQNAVDDGLNWLARHQGEDGHWGADCLGADSHSRCDQQAPCQGPGDAYEVAHTGLAVLAFQAAGNYYFNGQKYSDRVTKGLDYLVAEQALDGSIVGSQNPSQEQVAAGAPFQQYFMYEHAIATFALCEACAVALAEGKPPDPRYLNAAERAVIFLETVQHVDGGWRYSTNDREVSDCSVSGWVMLALKSAREAKLGLLPRTISGMLAFFSRHHVGDRTYYFNPSQQGTDAMTGVGMMAVAFFKHKLDSPIVTGGAAYLAAKADVRHERGALPECDYYLWYNCTMAMFQVGGEPWKRWNDAVREHVIRLQVGGDGCDRGSWPPADQWSSRGGRIYSTALAVLTLEVYYRFQRVAGQPENESFFEK
jgi:hypothetical protein